MKLLWGFTAVRRTVNQIVDRIIQSDKERISEIWELKNEIRDLTKRLDTMEVMRELDKMADAGTEEMVLYALEWIEKHETQSQDTLKFKEDMSIRVRILEDGDTLTGKQLAKAIMKQLRKAGKK